jgi:hypothetical protein
MGPVSNQILFQLHTQSPKFEKFLIIDMVTYKKWPPNQLHA